MAGFEGEDPSVVIEQVKLALAAAESKAGTDGLGYSLESVALELTAVQAHEDGVGFKIKIPFVEWELELGTKVSGEQTQIIAVELEPAAVEAEAAQGIDIPLATALLEIARIVAKARETEPKLQFKDASVDLQFVMSREGTVSLVVYEGSGKQVTTHKLKVDLKPN